MTITELKNKLHELENEGFGNVDVVCIAPQWEINTETIIGRELPLTFPWEVAEVEVVGDNEGRACHFGLSNPEVM